MLRMLKNFLRRDQFENLVIELKSASGVNNSELLNCLGSFIEQTHQLLDENVNCRRELSNLEIKDSPH